MNRIAAFGDILLSVLALLVSSLVGLLALPFYFGVLLWERWIRCFNMHWPWEPLRIKVQRGILECDYTKYPLHRIVVYADIRAWKQVKTVKVFLEWWQAGVDDLSYLKYYYYEEGLENVHGIFIFDGKSTNQFVFLLFIDMGFSARSVFPDRQKARLIIGKSKSNWFKISSKD